MRTIMNNIFIAAGLLLALPVAAHAAAGTQDLVPQFLLYFLLPYIGVGSLTLLGVFIGMSFTKSRLPGRILLFMYLGLILAAVIVFIPYRLSGALSPVVFWVVPLAVSILSLSLFLLRVGRR